MFLENWKEVHKYKCSDFASMIKKSAVLKASLDLVQWLNNRDISNILTSTNEGFKFKSNGKIQM